MTLGSVWIFWMGGIPEREGSRLELAALGATESVYSKMRLEGAWVMPGPAQS